MSSVTTTDPAAHAVASFIVRLEKHLLDSKQQIEVLEAELKIECPQARDPFSQDTLEKIWKTYQQNLREGQAIVQTDLETCKKTISDLFAASGPKACSTLLTDLVKQMNDLQTQIEQKKQQLLHLQNTIEALRKKPIFLF